MFKMWRPFLPPYDTCKCWKQIWVAIERQVLDRHRSMTKVSSILEKKGTPANKKGGEVKDLADNGVFHKPESGGPSIVS